MRLLTMEEVADILRVPRPRVYLMARRGWIPVVRIGRQIRVEETQLRDWIAQGGRSLDDESSMEQVAQ